MAKEPIVTVAKQITMNLTVYLVSIGVALVVGVVLGAIIF
jgi:hypothetical protein